MTTLKILSFFIFSIFLLSSANAMTVYADFSDSSQSATINVGDSISFNVDFFSMNPPITNMKAGIYSGDSLYYSFLDSSTNERTYYNTYTYVATLAGTYKIRVIGTDKINTDSEFLTLTVTSGPCPPTNHAPVITSVPISQVNEKASYTYDVQATDSDGDTLTYSLTEKPSWLSINPSTGLISGVAPSVSFNTNFNVEVEVSDGNGGIDTQTYTLKVKNLCDGDTTPPVITVISPENKEYETHTINLRVLTDEPAEMTFRLDEGITIDMNNPSDNLFTYTLHVDNEGSHIITFYAEDTSGNTAREYARFSIEIEDDDDEDDDDSNGFRIISDPDYYYQNKYFDQFNPDMVASTSKTSTANGYSFSAWVLFYILLGLISLGIIIVVFLLVRNLGG